MVTPFSVVGVSIIAENRISVKRKDVVFKQHLLCLTQHGFLGLDDPIHGNLMMILHGQPINITSVLWIMSNDIFFQRRSIATAFE